MRFKIFFVCLIAFLEVNAQSLFTGVYGNTSNNFVCKLAPNGEFVYAVGLNGNVTKLTNSGNLVYAIRTDSMFNYYDFATTNDDCLMAVGLTYIGAEKQTLITKIDPTGNVLWNKVYEGANRQMQQQIVQPIADVDSFVITNWHLETGGNDDIVVFKIDANGEIIWKYSYDYLDDQHDGITSDNDGGVLIAGSSTGPDGYIGSVLHLDADGNVVEGIGINNSLYALHKIIRASDNGYIIVGDDLDADNKRNPIVIKLNNLMEIEWAKAIKAGTALGTYPITGAGGVAEDSEGNIYATGIVFFGDENRQVISKYSSAGMLLMQRSFGTTANTEPFIIQIASKWDGVQDIIYASNTKDDIDATFGLRDMQLLAIDSSLNSCYLDPVTLDGESIELEIDEAFFDQAIMTLNVYELEGELLNYSFQPVSCDTFEVPDGINALWNESTTSLIIAPNPTSHNFSIENLPVDATAYSLSIYNMQGVLVYVLPVQNNWGSIQIEDLNLLPGAYILKLLNGKSTQKAVLIYK